MAIINVDDAYILNETGAQVDKTTGIPFKNESLTEAEAAQARANIRAGGSNDNLLDNWYFVGGGSQLGDGVFPINQRRQTSYSSPGINLDRWRNDGELTLYSDGITCGSYLYQAHPQALTEQLLGKTLTASILLNDGTIISGTGTFPASVPSSMQIVSYNADYELVSILADTWTQLFKFNGATLGGRHVKAAKLEFGTVSTLANDAPPNFFDEKKRCQSYLYVLDAPAYHFLGEVALAGDATNCTIAFHLPAEMRTTAPSVTLTSGLWVGGAQTTAVNWTRTLGTTVIAACTVTGGLSGSTLYAVATGASATTITISAEL